MSLSAVVLQILTGLASASALFLVGSGLSLIFGVTRVVNFAHGSFYMLGLYAAVSLAQAFAGIGPLGWWGGVLLAALLVAALGAAIEMLVLRRLYAAPELYQLLATFALVLVIRDAAPISGRSLTGHNRIGAIRGTVRRSRSDSTRNGKARYMPSMPVSRL